MANLDRKTTILLHIQNYCREIEKTFQFFGSQFETFETNFIFRNTISMSIFQICELTKILDKNDKEYIKQTENEVPWKSMIRMRELFAHHYLDMDYKIIFNTALYDVPKLENFINKELKNKA